ncbi:hypothetical protein MKX03_021947 [Papaver bracteatum]|nr:hypothetical protein MKX03_021947 [Papaver bracteatum]
MIILIIVYLNLGGSGNWPMDDIAIGKNKTCISSTDWRKVFVIASDNELDVLRSGYAFREAPCCVLLTSISIFCLLIYICGSNLKYGEDNIILGWDLLVQFVTYEINARSYEVLRRTTKTFPGGFSGELSNVSNNMLVALDPTGSTLISIRFGDGQFSFHQTAISDLLGNFSGMASIFPSKLSSMVALKLNSVLLFVVEKIDSPAAISDPLSISVTVKQANDWIGGNLAKETIVMDKKRGNVDKVFVNSEIVWSIDDGLASILDMTTSELPVEKEGVSVAKVEHSLFEWLKVNIFISYVLTQAFILGHLLKLEGTLVLGTPEGVVSIQGMRLKSSHKSKMTRDRNGRFLLCIGDGRVVWSFLLPSFKKSEACPNPTGLNFYQWQVPHQNAMDENPSVLVVGSCGGSNAPGVLSFIQVFNGTATNLLLDRKGHAFLYPRTPEALKLCPVELLNTYWYLIEAGKDIMRGHTLCKTCNFEGADEYCFDTRELFSLQIQRRLLLCFTTDWIVREKISVKSSSIFFENRIVYGGISFVPLFNLFPIYRLLTLQVLIQKILIVWILKINSLYDFVSILLQLQISFTQYTPLLSLNGAFQTWVFSLP